MAGCRSAAQAQRLGAALNPVGSPSRGCRSQSACSGKLCQAAPSQRAVHSRAGACCRISCNVGLGPSVGSQADLGGRTEGSQADFMLKPDTAIGSQAGLMGRPEAAIGKPAGPMGNAGVSMERGPILQQGRAAPGQQGHDEEDHEEGCALALLQEALSAAPGETKARMRARRSTTFDDGMPIAARHMQTEESALPPAGQLDFARYSSRQLSSLQQRIADYEKQNGLAALQGLGSVELLSDGTDGQFSSTDDAVSPLKQRIAEYNAPHIMCESPRSPSSPRIDSSFGNSSRTNH